MSTYGKRALKKWDYNGDKFQSLRFNNSPKEVQLAILEKWYPVGMTCKKRDISGQIHVGTTTYTLTGYEEHMTYYSVIAKHRFIEEDVETTHHPFQFVPDENWRKIEQRERRLATLGINEENN